MKPGKPWRNVCFLSKNSALCSRTRVYACVSTPAGNLPSLIPGLHRGLHNLFPTLTFDYSIFRTPLRTVQAQEMLGTGRAMTLIANILHASSVPGTVLPLKYVVQLDLCSPMRLVPSSIPHRHPLFIREKTQLHVDSPSVAELDFTKQSPPSSPEMRAGDSDTWSLCFCIY